MSDEVKCDGCGKPIAADDNATWKIGIPEGRHAAEIPRDMEAALRQGYTLLVTCSECQP